MKHIKLYENFTPLFRRLSIRDARDLYQSRGGHEEFTDSEIDRIKDIMKDEGELINKFIRGKVKYEVNWHKKRDKSKACRIGINKGMDEYFYITKESLFTNSIGVWECDTIDGLIECLKTLI